jgi:hypothetical protein
MGNVREALHEAFEAVKGTMEDTVKSVKGTVGETVDAVKHVDVKGGMERHPWLYIGGFMALGYFAYRLLEQAGQTRSSSGEGTATGSTTPAAGSAPSHGHGNGRHREENQSSGEQAAQPATSAPRSEDWGQVLAELKALAIGVPLSIVRDKLANTGAETFRSEVVELMNSLTEKLGGKVVQDRQQFAS